jgi:hypothetical protein
MVATFGRRPNIGKQVVVSSEHDFTGGEYGMLRNYQWRSDQTYKQNEMPSEQECIAEFRKKFNENDKSEIVFIKLHRDWEYVSGDQGHANITVDECIFKGNGIVIATAIAIIIIVLALVAITFFVLFPGIVYTLFGITPGQAVKFQFSQLPVLILIVLLSITVVGGLIIFWPKISKWAKEAGSKGAQYARRYL